MCLPAAAVGPLLIGSTVVSALGTGVAAMQGAAYSRYQARLAERNAPLEHEAAQDALKRGEIEAQRQYRKIGQVQGAQRAAMDANNIDPDFGSAGRLQEDTAMLGREDVATIYDNSYREARGFSVSGANFRAQAAGYRQQAKGQAIAGAFGVGSTFLGGATQYAQFRALR